VIDDFRPRTEKSGNHCHRLYHRRRLTVNFFAGVCFGDRVLCGLAIARILTSDGQIVPISKRVYWYSSFWPDRRLRYSLFLALCWNMSRLVCHMWLVRRVSVSLLCLVA